MIQKFRHYLSKKTLEQLNKLFKLVIIVSFVILLFICARIAFSVVIEVNIFEGIFLVCLFAFDFLFFYIIMIELILIKKEENSKKSRKIFAESNILDISCPPFKDATEYKTIIYKLESQKEISFQAELIDEKIFIHVKTKDGNIYKNILSFDDVSFFDDVNL